MNNIYYKSDFKLREHHKDLSVPFKFTYSVGCGNPYTASFDGATYTNCKIEDGVLVVIFNDHNIGVGQLYVIREWFLTDQDFADRTFNKITKDRSDVYLADSVSDNYEVDVDVAPSWTKGDPFRYEDFTPEQLEALRGKDYVLTDEDLKKIAEIAGGADLSEFKEELAKKVDKEEDKGLSTNDFTDEDKSKLDSLSNFDDSELQREMSAKVDKVLGKSLSTNDFTNLLKAKLEGTMPATEITAAISSVQGKIDNLASLFSTDASSAIDTYNEIVAFLSNFTDNQDLASVLLSLKQEIVKQIPNVPQWALQASKPTYGWAEIDGKPTWIGDNKPTYSAEEVGALPADTQIPSTEGLATEGYVDQKIGDIDTVLDNIITIQETI